MMKIPPFWRKLQLQARPTVHFAAVKLRRLVRTGKMTEAQAHEIARQIAANVRKVA